MHAIDCLGRDGGEHQSFDRKTTKAVASICEYLSSNPLGLFGTILE